MADSTNRGRTLERALSIIDFVSDSHTPLRLSQIAQGTSLHIATAQRMINTLVSRGYLVNLDGTYSIGPSVLPLARSFTVQDRLSTVAFPQLVWLTEKTGLTASIYVKQENYRILTARNNAPGTLSYQLPIGKKLELQFGGGRVLLAFLNDSERDSLIESIPFPIRLTDGRTESKAKFTEVLSHILANGYYLSTAEREPGTVGLAAPILPGNNTNQAVATINIVASHDTITPEKMLSFRPLLLEAAAAISQGI